MTNTTQTQCTAAPSPSVDSNKRSTQRPSAHAKRTKEGLTLDVWIPGATRDDLDLAIEDGVLELRAASSVTDFAEDAAATRAEFRAADYAGRWTLPDDVTHEGARTTLEHGVLRIHLPKVAPGRHRLTIA